MNIFSQNTSVRPNAPVHMGSQEYPKQLNKAGAPFIIVHDEDEEHAAELRGYSDKPLAITPRLEVATPMTTPVAVQSAYDALKKEFQETVTAFNLKWSELTYQQETLQAQYLELDQKYQAIVQDHAILSKTHEKMVSRMTAPAEAEDMANLLKSAKG